MGQQGQSHLRIRDTTIRAVLRRCSRSATRQSHRRLRHLRPIARRRKPNTHHRQAGTRPMEIQEVERPFREIDISQVGPIIINSLTQINLDTGCIGKPGDLFFSPIKYDYIPNTRLTITMSEPFILDIKKAAIRNTSRLVRAGLRRWSYIPLLHA